MQAPRPRCALCKVHPRRSGSRCGYSTKHGGLVVWRCPVWCGCRGWFCAAATHLPAEVPRLQCVEERAWHNAQHGSTCAARGSQEEARAPKAVGFRWRCSGTCGRPRLESPELDVHLCHQNAASASASAWIAPRWRGRGLSLTWEHAATHTASREAGVGCRW